jgi:hypothetical protein
MKNLITGLALMLITTSAGADTLSALMSSWVDNFNKTLPAMADEFTRVDSATVKGRVVEYRYTVVGLSAADIGSFEPVLSGMRDALCNEPDVLAVAGLGFDILYIYRDQHGKLLGRVRINCKICGGCD